MTDVRGCRIPEDLLYWIEKHVWVRDEGDSLVLGITDPAQRLASRVVAVTAKKVGRVVERGQSVATVESGKWVGPVPAPVDGEIVEVNAAVGADPTLLNSDPYGAGWILRLRPSRWGEQRGELAMGAAAVDGYRAFLEDQGISCE